jgi:hypothetical protein
MSHVIYTKKVLGIKKLLILTNIPNAHSIKEGFKVHTKIGSQPTI